MPRVSEVAWFLIGVGAGRLIYVFFELSGYNLELVPLAGDVFLPIIAGVAILYVTKIRREAGSGPE